MLSKEEIKRGIDNNYNMVCEAEALIQKESDEESRLRIASFVSLLYAVYVTGIYSSVELENEIIKVGRNIIVSPYKPPKNKKILHVLTRGGNYGGHSVLACNFIKWDKEHESSVVFTDMEENEVPQIFRQAVMMSGGEIYTLRGGFFDKAKQLIRISKDYQAIVLHMHMNDVVPVLAYSNVEWKTPVFFCNHADFRFSLGFCVSDKILNITHFDVEKNISHRGTKREQNEMLFFPSPEDMGVNEVNKRIRRKYSIPEDKRLVVSMGADYKYHPVMEWDFALFAKRLMDTVHDVIFVVIGADPKKEEWIRLRKNTNDCIIALGVLSKEDAQSLIAEASLYISSFPMIAAGAMIARKYEIPNLTLLITGRNKEYFGNNAAEGMEELLQKSVEVLQGNGEKYIGNDITIDLSMESWQDKWREILATTKEHGLQDISPKRVIDVQEYIDYEMLNEDAPEWIGDFLWRNRKDIDLYHKAIELQRKWGIRLIPDDHLEMLTGEVEIYKKLYLRMLKWTRIKDIGKLLLEYLAAQNMKEVAIYGYGAMGELLLEEFLKNGKSPVCCIDKYPYDKSCGIKLLLPKEFENRYNGELIINTTVFENEVILEEFSRKDLRMVTIEQLFEYVS